MMAEPREPQLEVAVARFPFAPHAPHHLARLIEAEGGWPEAERCWGVYIATNPGGWGPRLCGMPLRCGRTHEGLKH
jgi:hypothetical protein